MAEYDSAVALALRLIAKKGGDVTLRRPNVPVENLTAPWKPTAPTPVNTDQTIRAVFLDLPLLHKPMAYADGTLVRIGDKSMLVAASGLTFEPSLGYLVVRADGSIWTIKYLNLVDPNGRKIVFEAWITQ